MGSALALFGAVARRMTWRGYGSGRSPTPGFRNLASFIPGRTNALPSLTQGGSPVRELRSLGSERGVSGNRYPYRDPRPRAGWSATVRSTQGGLRISCPWNREQSKLRYLDSVGIIHIFW